jgi:hypothetical protein
MDPDELRRRASQYRDIARRITDERTMKALNDLADEYEARRRCTGASVPNGAWAERLSASAAA